MNRSPRVAELVALFERIATTRMADVPVLNPALAVQAVGFEAEAVATGAVDGPPVDTAPAEVGVLVTPWFMNLVWLPPADAAMATRVGESRQRTVGRERFDFIGAHEEGFGAYEACSLFSPMFEFVDQAAAVATAQAVLDTLRAPPAPPAARPAPALDRRRLLFGRAAGSASAGARP